MWKGTVTLHDCSAVYVGQTDQNTAHALVAVQLAIGVNGKVAVDMGRHCISARAVVIRPWRSIEWARVDKSSLYMLSHSRRLGVVSSRHPVSTPRCRAHRQQQVTTHVVET